MTTTTTINNNISTQMPVSLPQEDYLFIDSHKKRAAELVKRQNLQIEKCGILNVNSTSFDSNIDHDHLTATVDQLLEQFHRQQSSNVTGILDPDHLSRNVNQNFLSGPQKNPNPHLEAENKPTVPFIVDEVRPISPSDDKKFFQFFERNNQIDYNEQKGNYNSSNYTLNSKKGPSIAQNLQVPTSYVGQNTYDYNFSSKESQFSNLNSFEKEVVLSAAENQSKTFDPSYSNQIYDKKSHNIYNHSSDNYRTEDSDERSNHRKRIREESNNHRSEKELENIINQKLTIARSKLDQLEARNSSINSELYTLFSDLQVISAEFGIFFDAPEVVVVGMQSDGKSSFIEGLLGFQFNIVDTNIGTRRPLIIQMINNSQNIKPSCHFLKEDSAFLGVEQNIFEETETPIEELSKEIISRTNAKTGSSKDCVSDVPIILRVQYKYCANLTIFDTPGFRLGGIESLKKDIQEMVIRIASPKNRIIVCLDQSTVEWVNTISRPLIARLDPDFSRTIIVNTKFDNRVKELRGPECTNKYLEGEGLPHNKKPFFISMPVRRDLNLGEFKKEMKECYLKDLEYLLKSGFDEERFMGQIGIFNLKSHLEMIIYNRYISCIAPNMQKLDSLIIDTTEELNQISIEIEEANIEKHKRRVRQFIQIFCSHIDRLLRGSIVHNSEYYGQTLMNEKLSSSILSWPISNKIHWTHLEENIPYTSGFGVECPSSVGGSKIPNVVDGSEPRPHSRTNLDTISNGDNGHPEGNSSQIATEKIKFEISNENLALYGGAQFNRLLTEFEYVAHSLEMPISSPDEIASVLGMSRNHNLPNVFDAASDIARSKCKLCFYPLIHVVLRRSNYIFGRIFDIALQMIIDERQNIENNLVALTSCPGFMKEIKSVYQGFLNSLIHNCDRSMRQDISKLITVVDWGLLSGIQELSRECEFNPPASLTQERVNRIMNIDLFQDYKFSPDCDKYQMTLKLACKLFSGMRFFFVKYAKANMNTHLLDPMFTELFPHFMDYFSVLTTQKLENLFLLNADSLRERKEKLGYQLQKLTLTKEKFEQLFAKLRLASQVEGLRR